MENFDVLIVVPLYNATDFVDSFFNCLELQTYKFFQICFVYDNSSDDTLSKLENLVRGYSDLNCKVFCKPHKDGVGKARDFGLDNAAFIPKYLIFLDIDDKPLPDFLYKLHALAEAKDSDLTICGYRRINSTTGKVISVEMINNDVNFVPGGKDLSSLVYINPAMWNKLIKSNVVKDARFIFPGGCGEDAMFFAKILPRCQKIAFINEPLYDYFVHTFSLSSSTNEKNLPIIYEGFKDVFQYYQKNGKDFLRYYDFLEAFVFLRLGIGSTTKACLLNPKDQKKIIKETTEFLDYEFSGWRKNPYLSFFPTPKNSLIAFILHRPTHSATRRHRWR